MSNADVEAQFTGKLQAAFQSQFRGFQHSLPRREMAKHVSSQTDAVPRLLLSWQDETGQQWCSQRLQVATS